MSDEKQGGSTYGGHHLSHVAQVRKLSVRSGTTSFSATTYSYRETSTSRISSGTVETSMSANIPEACFSALQGGSRTVSNAAGLYDFEFLPDPRVEQTLEIKSVWSFLPPSEVRNLVSVNNVAFCAQLAEVANFGIYCSQQEPGVRYSAVAHVARSIIPRQSHSRYRAVSFTIFIESRGALSWQKLHNAGHRVRGPVANGPGRRAVNVVFEK